MDALPHATPRALPPHRPSPAAPTSSCASAPASLMFKATISAATLPLICDVFDEAGLDVSRALAETGLSPSRPGAQPIPLDRFTALLQNAGLQAANDACLWSCGRRIAEPALATLFPSGLGETRLGGLLAGVLYDLQAMQEGTTFECRVQDDTCILAYRIHDPRIWPRSRDAEFTLGFLHAIVERSAGPDLPAHLTLEHEQDGSSAALSRQARSVPLYGQPLNMLAFPARLLDRIVDPGALMPAAAPQTPPQPPRGDRAPGHGIAEAIRRRVGQGPFSQGDIAADLGMSGRSLRRLLDGEGSTFRAMAEEARLDYALWALRRTTLAVGEIAWRLGYDDQGAFSRAFRRLTGQTPSQVRSKPHDPEASGDRQEVRGGDRTPA